MTVAAEMHLAGTCRAAILRYGTMVAALKNAALLGSEVSAMTAAAPCVRSPWRAVLVGPVTFSDSICVSSTAWACW